MFTPGRRCTCKPGEHRDNCPTCEGTGWQIDFAAIHAQRNATRSTCPNCGRILTADELEAGSEDGSTCSDCWSDSA